ncbi:hypothetical protein Avi_9519 (plasmid) [Allorhizobium ampelinum S4]|uniref:Uncharacterized protein n=1 Tax=Allorhizobium ampelinum (strain ATCC BAA-846 / DSM 112012 / S4) TaxID=311402 RepID=B9K323_ALLAM|nr:hypothetical protein Avi_9519 [Allorhizobium ampelinum S4]
MHQGFSLLKCEKPDPPINVHCEHIIVMQYFLYGFICCRYFAACLLLPKLTVQFMSVAPQGHLAHRLSKLPKLSWTSCKHRGEKRCEVELRHRR